MATNGFPEKKNSFDKISNPVIKELQQAHFNVLNSEGRAQFFSKYMESYRKLGDTYWSAFLYTQDLSRSHLFKDTLSFGFVSQICLAILESINPDKSTSHLAVTSNAKTFVSNFTLSDFKEWILNNLQFLCSKLGYPCFVSSEDRNNYLEYHIFLGKFIDELFAGLPDSHDYAAHLYATWYRISSGLQIYPANKDFRHSVLLKEKIKLYQQEKWLINGVDITSVNSTESCAFAQKIKKENSRGRGARDRQNGPTDEPGRAERMSKELPNIIALQKLHQILGKFKYCLECELEIKSGIENKAILKELSSSLNELIGKGLTSEERFVQEYVKKHIDLKKLEKLSAEQCIIYLDKEILKNIWIALADYNQKNHHQHDRSLVCEDDILLPVALEEEALQNTIQIIMKRWNEYDPTSTACVARVHQNTITFANLGDSMGILFYRKKGTLSIQALKLTLDHSSNNNLISVNNGIIFGSKKLVGPIDTITYTISKEAFSEYDFYLSLMTKGCVERNSIETLCSAFQEESKNKAENQNYQSSSDKGDSKVNSDKVDSKNVSESAKYQTLSEKILQITYNYGAVDNATALVLKLNQNNVGLLMGVFDGENGIAMSSNLSQAFQWVHKREAKKLSEKLLTNPVMPMNFNSNGYSKYRVKSEYNSLINKCFQKLLLLEEKAAQLGSTFKGLSYKMGRALNDNDLSPNLRENSMKMNWDIVAKRIEDYEKHVGNFPYDLIKWRREYAIQLLKNAAKLDSARGSMMTPDEMEALYSEFQNYYKIALNALLALEIMLNEMLARQKSMMDDYQVCIQEIQTVGKQQKQQKGLEKKRIDELRISFTERFTKEVNTLRSSIEQTVRGEYESRIQREIELRVQAEVKERVDKALLSLNSQELTAQNGDSKSAADIGVSTNNTTNTSTPFSPLYNAGNTETNRALMTLSQTNEKRSTNLNNNSIPKG